MSRGKAIVSLCLALVSGTGLAATSTSRTSRPRQPRPPAQEQQALRPKLNTRRLLLMAPSPSAGLPHSTTPPRRRAFRIPALSGMNLHPGDVVVDRYVPPPPPWLHVHVHCAIANGNMYVDGTVTGNYGRPIPGEIIYQGRGGDVLGSETSSRSGQIHGVEPLTGGHVILPPGLRKFPLHCVAPNVNVGTPSHVTPNVQGSGAVH